MNSGIVPVRGLLAAISVVAVIFALAMPARAQFSFLGVASGDVASTSAVLWTRGVDTAAPSATAITLQLSIDDPTFLNVWASMTLTTDPTRDFTAKTQVGNLTPGTRYHYRFISGSVISNVGTFVTAPDAATAAAVRFAFSGDCDGLMRPYPLANALAALNLDFFVFLGDTIYENASAGSPSVTLSGTTPAPSSNGATQAQLYNDYARKYREQFVAVNAGGQECLKPLFAAQGNYTLLDNHELGNRQYINGGAAPGGPVGDMPSGAGVECAPGGQ